MRPKPRSHLRSPSPWPGLFLLLSALGCAAGEATAAYPPAGGAPSSSSPPPSSSPSPSAPAADAAVQAAARADAALDVLLTRYWRAEDGTFTVGIDGSGGATGYWTAAQALDVVLDGVAREGPARGGAVVQAFFAAQDRRGWTRDWFDDEAWMALALLRAHELLGDARYLDRAVALAEDIRAGAVDSSCCGSAPGGLWWDRAHTQKATAANAGTALLAARLYERTGEARWLDFARTTFDWWRDHMMDPATGQVADHLDRAGAKTWWRFTYNEGTMIGAAVALHRAAGAAGDLELARRLAAFVRAHEVRPTAVGDVLFDGDACTGDCEQFKGIAHRYLGELVAADPDVPGIADLLSADADAAWTLARDGAGGGFAVDWNGPPAGRSLMATSSAGTALAVEAARAAAARTVENAPAL